MNTISFHHKWAEDMAEKYASGLDDIVMAHMPEWIRRYTEERRFGWVKLGQWWSWWVGLEVRLGPGLRFTEVYIRGKQVGSIIYGTR